MTSESLVQTAVQHIWVMARHTQSICCNRYVQVNHERICRKCMTKNIRAFYEHADAAEASTSPNTHTTHTESESP